MASVMNLTLVSPADNASFGVPDAAPEMTPVDLISELIAQGAIPALPAGQSYVLAVKGGHQLDDGQSLEANGVTDGVTLQLIAPTPGASFEGEAAIVGLPLLPIAVVGAVAVGAGYAAYKTSCLLGRGLVYTAGEARKAWAAHAATERARAASEAQARRQQLREEISRCELPTLGRAPQSSGPVRRIEVSVSRAASEAFGAAEERLATTIDLPAWRELYAGYLRPGAEDAIRSKAGQMRAHLIANRSEAMNQAVRELAEELAAEVRYAEDTGDAANELRVAALGLRTELGSMEKDAVMAQLLAQTEVDGIRARLARVEETLRAGRVADGEKMLKAAERKLGAMREAAFGELSRLQREHVSAKVAETLAAMGYGSPAATEAGNWTLLSGSNGVRPFTVAITDDLRLVFDLGHEGFDGLTPCRAEVQGFLDRLAEGFELGGVKLTPSHPQAVQEQAALALLRRLQEMGATVAVEHEGGEVVLTAALPDEEVSYRVGPQGETATARSTTTKSRGRNHGEKKAIRTR